MRKIGLLILIIFACWACHEDELDGYSGTDGIYFAALVNNKVDYTDTTLFSFAFAPVPDTIIRISVRGYGQVVDYDRKFRVAVEGGNAVAGVNFETLEEEYVLKADSVYSYVPVKIFREGTRDTTFYITLRLLPNQDFLHNVPFKKVNGDTVDITRHVIAFTNKLNKPMMWTGLGYWSEAKFYLLNEELGYKAEDWYDASKRSEMGKKDMGAGTYMVNYLNLFIKNNDYRNMPKDPEAPAANRGYMTFESFSGGKVTIPGSWPDASDIK